MAITDFILQILPKKWKIGSDEPQNPLYQILSFLSDMARITALTVLGLQILNNLPF